MPRTQDLLIGYFRLLLRIFFRRIVVTGVDNIPEDRGGLLVAWHPNGAIDGGVLLTHFPRQMVTGARHGLLEIPVLGWMMRRLGAVPIYRRADASADTEEAARQADNRRSIDELASAVAGGRFAALFPEGKSHDEPSVQELKTGAAHLYYRACELRAKGTPLPAIIPVALHYSEKARVGSQVQISFHPPIDLPEELAAPLAGEDRRDQARRLTAEFDRVLREVVLATESWRLHRLFDRARKLIRAEGLARQGAKSLPPDITERVRHFGRVWSGYQQGRRSFPEETRALLGEVDRYDRLLHALRIEDHELDASPWVDSPKKALLLLFEVLLVFLVMPAFVLIGILINLPTILLLHLFTKATADEYKDEASIKVLVGAVAFPLTWLIVAILVAWGGTGLAAAYPEIEYSALLTGVLAFFLCASGAILALRFRQIATETYRSIRVRITLARRRRIVDRLLAERSRLFDRFLEMDRRFAESAAR